MKKDVALEALLLGRKDGREQGTAEGMLASGEIIRQFLKPVYKQSPAVAVTLLAVKVLREMGMEL